MDPLTILGIAALVGYWVFSDKKEDPAALERAREEQRHAERIAEEARKKREEEERARTTPFPSSRACFESQYVSFSRLSTYCNCPQRFKLVYLDRRRPASAWYFGRGSTFHSQIASHLRRYVGNRAEPMSVSAITSGFHKKTPANRKAARFFCKTFPWEAEIVAVEHEFSFTLGGIRLFGIVDCVVRHPDGILEILDFKTGVSHRPKREQLECYGLPYLLQNDSARIYLRYLFLDRGHHYRWQLRSSDASEVAARIRRLIDTIVTDTRFEPVVGSHCANCGVREHCMYASLAASGTVPEEFRIRRHSLTPIQRRGRDTKSIIYEESAAESIGKTASKRSRSRRSGLGFDYVCAKCNYVCALTGVSIAAGEYHFASHSGKRIGVSAFRNAHPEDYQRVLARLAEQAMGGLPRSFRRLTARENYPCSQCSMTIAVGESYFSNKGAKRFHERCAKSRYGDGGV